MMAYLTHLNLSFLQEAVESEHVAVTRSWLQECCISLSPSNDTLAVAKNDKAVFLTSK